MGALLKNTVYLYLLQFANYAFSLITLPLITRVLGPEIYGRIGFAMAFCVYFTLVVDFGFRLSATKAVSDNRNCSEKVSEIVCCITIAKLSIGALLSILLGICCIFFTPMRDNTALLYLYLIFATLSSLVPDYLYRGLENMKIVTYRAVLMKGVFTCLIFFFLRKPSQLYFIPIFQIIGELAALTWIYYDIRCNLKLRLSMPGFSKVFFHVKESTQYFLSRIASTVYNVANTTILGFLYPGSAIIGYYTSADRVRSVACSALTPIADSFYPYMNRTKDYRKLFIATFSLEIPIIIGCLIGWFFADQICTLLFGHEFEDAATLLRWMLPVVAITYPSYMFGFPMLTALNLTKWANYSVEFATLNQVIGIVLLALFFEINAVNLCILTLISETIVLLVRIIVIIKHKSKLQIR